MRPPAVQEITQNMLVETSFFGGLGLALIILGQVASQCFATAVCVGLGLFVIGLVYGTLAIGFNKLHPWAYEPVLIVEGTWWASPFARGRGFGKKLKSPEVRKAFGLPPLQLEEAHEK